MALASMLRSGLLASLAPDRGGDLLGARVAERADDSGGNVGGAVAQRERDRALGVSTSAPGGTKPLGCA